MTPRKRKDPGLIISVPLELAREIFSESGDLPSARFPAIMILADTIGKALPINHEKSVQRPIPKVLSRSRKAKTTFKRPEDYPFLTR